ncbi:MAG: hypothetical protein ACU836_15855 [Gammaproteobacteria bacterium]
MPVKIGSMGEKRIDIKSPLLEVSFYCHWCRSKFAREPERIEDAPDRNHPYLYYANCDCGHEAEQAHWEKGLMAAYGKSIGPTTEAGKAASAKNLEKAHTPEIHARTRFNGLKTGMHANVLTYFPARPGQYPMCEGCEIKNSFCEQNTVCMKEADRHMRYRIAFENNDYSFIREDHASMHATVQTIINNMMLKIVQTGVEIRAPVWYIDPEDGFQLAEYTDPSTGERRFIEEIKAHPLLKVLSEFIGKNSLSLSELGMTRVQEQENHIKGHLDHDAARGDSMLEYQERQTNALEGLRAMIEASQRRVNSDPILIEHARDEG